MLLPLHTRHFTVGLLAFALVMLVSLIPAKDVDPKDPKHPLAGKFPLEEIQKAEAVFTDVYGKDYERVLKKGNGTEKLAYAKKLQKASEMVPENSALQVLMLHRSLALARVAPGGLKTVAEILKKFYSDPKQKGTRAAEYAAILEKLLPIEPMNERPKLVKELVGVYKDASSEQARAGDVAYLKSTGRAKDLARLSAAKWPEFKDVYRDVDEYEKGLARIYNEAKEINRLLDLVLKDPNHVEGTVGLVAVDLRAGRKGEAAKRLQAHENEKFKQLGGLLASDKTPASDLAKAYVTAAEVGTAPKEKLPLLIEAVRLYANASIDAEETKAEAILLDRLAALKQVVQLADPAGKVTYAGELVDCLGEWLEIARGRGKIDDAVKMLTESKTFLRGILKEPTAKSVLGDLDQLEAGFKTTVELNTERARLEKELATDADSGKVNQAYALVMIRLGEMSKAAPALSRSESNGLKKVGGLLSQTKAASAVELGDALRSAAQEFKGEERTALLRAAREKYEEFLAGAPKDAPERTRVALLVKELPTPQAQQRSNNKGDVLDIFSDAATWVKVFNEQTGESAGRAEAEKVKAESCITIRGGYVQCSVPSGQTYRIVELPQKPNEFRYIGFWVKKTGGKEVDIHINLSDGMKEKEVLYIATSDESISNRIAGSGPFPWQLVVRDLFHDANQSGLINKLSIGNRDSGTVSVSHLVVGRRPQAVRAYLTRLKPD